MDISPTFQSVNGLLETSFKKNWDLPAVSNWQGRPVYYNEVATRIAMMHIAFEKCGLQKGDKVALCSRNHANWAVTFMATITYGAVAVPLLHEFKADNIHYLVNHSEAKVLFVDGQIWEGLNPEDMPAVEVVVQIDPFKVIYTSSDAHMQVWTHLIQSFGERYPSSFGPEDVIYHRDEPDELAMISYTSGTSGFSKGVMIPYRAIWSNLYFASKAEPMVGAGDKLVAILPSAHMFGLMFELMYEIVAGCHVHYLTRLPSPKVIMKAFGEVKPCMIVSVPLIFEKIYKNKLKPIVDKNKIFFSLPILDKVLERKIRDELYSTFGGQFEEVILGGAAFNPEVEAFLRKVGFPFTVGYGMTECGPIISYAHWNESRQGSCGRIVPNMELRIDSRDPYNIPGEVLVKGDNVFLGYFKNQEATDAVLEPDGWLHTGDMGVVDKDGFLYLRGRNKCMILGPSGQNIYPEELEAVVNNLRFVVDSLVIEDQGLVALIYPDYPQAELDGIGRDAMLKHFTDLLPEINRQLPNYAQIRKVELMPEDFERTPKKSIKRYLYQRN